MSGQRAVRLWSPVARRWLTVLAVATAAGAMALVSASPARSVATTLTLTPTADAYVDSSKPTTNFGAAPQLQQDAASASKMISFLTFTVTGLTGAPTSAVLNLMSRSTGVTKTQVLAASTAWSENTVTWNNQPPVGSLISTTGALTSGAVISADVTRAVTGNGVYTFALETGATAVRYDDSREAVANTPTPPSLVVSYDAPTSPPTTSSPPTSSTPTTTTPTTSTPDTSTPDTSSPDTSSPDTTTPASTTPAPSTSDSSTSPTPTTSTSTSSPPPPDPVVMVAGDIACAPNDPNFNALNGMPGYCHMKTTAALEKTLAPTAVLALGDEQYNSGNPNDFRASYDPTWGAFRALTRPAVGNHEYGTSGAGGYFGYFGSAATGGGAPCASGCGGYYSFDLGAWHLIAINTECTRINGGAGCATGSPQETWLRADLAAHPNACTLVFGHRPRWSSNSFASSDIAPLITDMSNAHVDLYVSGHSHSYERFNPQNAAGAAAADGITQLVVGTGGSFYTGFGTVVANSAIHKPNIFGVVSLTLHPNSWDYTFIADPSTPFTDAGTSVPCH